jgi:predicted nucleic acid-binding protein
MQRLLLDSNVLIDYVAQRTPYYADARKLMILGAIGEVELWLSASQLSDVFYILSEGGKPAQSSTCQEQLKRCRKFIHVCSTTEIDVDAALDANWLDFEDALVHQCALKLNTDFIISRDKTGFSESKIPCIDATGYFKFLKDTKGISYTEMIQHAE